MNARALHLFTNCQWSEVFPVAPVQFLSPFIDNFLKIGHPDYLCFPLPPIPYQLMLLLLALVTIPVISQWIK